MTLDDVLDLSTVSPNCDLDAWVADATSDDHFVAVAIGADPSGVVLIDESGPSVGASLTPAFLGLNQGPSVAGTPSRVRVAGFSRVTFGASVNVNDFVMIDPATQRIIPFDVTDGNGHSHVATIATVRRVIYVVNEKNNALTGVDPGDFTVAVERWSPGGGALVAATELPTISEIGGGRYLISILPETVGVLYVVSVSLGENVVTPSEHQFDSTATYGQPSVMSLGMIVGFAITGGNDGDRGIVCLRPQLF